MGKKSSSEEQALKTKDVCVLRKERARGQIGEDMR